jgi:hypothetical protein
VRKPKINAEGRAVLRMIQEEQLYGGANPTGLSSDEVFRTTKYLQRIGMVGENRRLTAAGFEFLREFQP